MRFSELENQKSVPKTAGLATLEFLQGNHNKNYKPTREESTIIIPRRNTWEYFPLTPAWEQFCVVSCENQEIFFGGTDEQPFLVQLRNEPLKALLKKGKEAFYQSLLPRGLSLFAKQNNLPLKRQGDIFATPFPWSLEELSQKFLKLLKKFDRLKSCIKKQQREVDILNIDIGDSVFNVEDAKENFEKILGTLTLEQSNAHEKGIFGTRHILTKGSAVKINYHCRHRLWADCYDYKKQSFDNILENAVISAPDHMDMALPGLHIIEQANNLFDPKNAD